MRLRLLRYWRQAYHLATFAWTADWSHSLEVEHYRFTSITKRT